MKLRRSWDEEEEDFDDEEGECPEYLEVEGPSYSAVYTGLLKLNGDPIIRHPVVLRTGFHPERNQYHTPTLEETGFDEDHGRVFGWAYEC